MELKDQVCTLEQGNRLRELGVPLKCLFGHCMVSISVEDSEGAILLINDKNSRIPDDATTLLAPAYTAPELGEMLPSESGIIGWDVCYNDHIGCWNCKIYDIQKYVEEASGLYSPPALYESEGDSMVEAMANALIHCLENKLVTPIGG